MLGLFRLNLAQKPCFAMLFKFKKNDSVYFKTVLT